MRVFIDTMGCRTNAADSSLLMAALQQRGVLVTSNPSEADWILLNSCTVTHKADRDTGKLLRRYRSLPSCPSVMVLGCLPSATPTHPVLQLADAVVPGWDLEGVAAALFSGSTSQDPPEQAAQERFGLERILGLSRVNIKICQGCDGHCSYCIVPTARGKPVSYSPEGVLREVSLAQEWGFQEVILSGTHLLKYGRDLEPPMDLLALMAQLEQLPPGLRFRFGSVEPDPMLDRVLERMVESRRWCRHLHIAIQHASDEILASMRRQYPFSTVKNALERAHSMLPLLTVGMDFIVGFPGETDEAFEEAYRRLCDLPFTYMHVFAFSPRPGTPAAQWLDRVPDPEVVKARSARLRSLSNQRKRTALRALLGTQVEVLVERHDPKNPGFVTGHSDNYFEVSLPGDSSLLGTTVLCMPTEVAGDTLYVKPTAPAEQKR